MAIYRQWNPNMITPGEYKICDHCKTIPSKIEKPIETERGWLAITKCRCGKLEKVQLMKYNYYTRGRMVP